MRRVDVKITHDGPTHYFTIEFDGGWKEEKAAIDKYKKEHCIGGVIIIERSNHRTLMPIEKVKKGEYFRLRDTPTAPVWIRDEYSNLEWPRGKGRYCCTQYEDINAVTYLKKGRIVVTDFNF